MRRPSRDTQAHAAAGVLAAAVGMAVAHLVASLLDPAASPVLAVGSTVIDATPTPVKEWAVRTFGTADKPILIGNVLVVTLLAAALAGVLARRRPRLGLGLLLLLAVLAGAAALTRPRAGTVDVVPALAAAVAGLLTLWWLVRVRRASGDTTAGPAAALPVRSRRGFLIGSGALLVGGAVAAGAGQWIIRTRARISDIVLPSPDQGTAAAAGRARGRVRRHHAVPDARTATFYRVDTKLAVPLVDQTSWRLAVDGMVDREVSFSYDDLLGDAADRARHHPDLRLQRGRRQATSAAPAGSAYRCGRCSTGPASAHRRRPDPVAPTSTAYDQHAARRS